MEKTLYDMMDWAGIEELVYSEALYPHRLLGAHEDGTWSTRTGIYPYSRKVR